MLGDHAFRFCSSGRLALLAARRLSRPGNDRAFGAKFALSVWIDARLGLIPPLGLDSSIHEEPSAGGLAFFL